MSSRGYSMSNKAMKTTAPQNKSEDLSSSSAKSNKFPTQTELIKTQTQTNSLNFQGFVLHDNGHDCKEVSREHRAA